MRLTDDVVAEMVGGTQMTVAKAPQFKSFEAYLLAEPSDLPEGRFEYWDGDLVAVMSESIGNDAIANFIFIALVSAGIPFRLIRPHSCEVEVPGRPRTRLPDLTCLDEAHLDLLKRRATITRDMPPPRLVAEVVSPGGETSENYQRDYQEKRDQYAAIGIPEYWLVDPDRAVVLVGVLTDGLYQFQAFRGNDPIVSLIFPILNLTAAQILMAGQPGESLL
jgi:Uma2 family endonuclease